MRCEVEQAEFTYQATLRLPLLDALATPHLYAAILSGLGQFRVKLPDIQVHSAGPNPSDQLLVCLVPILSAVIRYRLDRIEVSSSSQRCNEEKLGALIDAALAIARGASQTFVTESHAMALAVHGRVSGGTTASLIGTYAPKDVPGTPLLKPQGVTFRVDAPPPASLSTVGLEHSLVVEGGIFMRFVNFQPGELPARDAFSNGMLFIQDVTRRLDCELRWFED